MKHVILATSGLLATLCLAPATLAALQHGSATPTSAVDDQHVGKIQRVGPDGTSFVLDVDGRLFTLLVNENTQFSLDGQATTRERALVAGRTASVTHDGEMASKVAAKSREE